jgi:hypothetical protein
MAMTPVWDVSPHPDATPDEAPCGPPPNAGDCAPSAATTANGAAAVPGSTSTSPAGTPARRTIARPKTGSHPGLEAGACGLPRVSQRHCPGQSGLGDARNHSFPLRRTRRDESRAVRPEVRNAGSGRTGAPAR